MYSTCQTSGNPGNSRIWNKNHNKITMQIIQESQRRSCGGVRASFAGNLPFRTPATRRRHIRWGLNPAIDANKLLTAYRGWSHPTSDIECRNCPIF